jgi:glycosyltransferase involved in cell wall biosynthesis
MLEQVIRLVLLEQPATRFEIVASHLDASHPKAYEALAALPNVRLRLEKISDAALRNIYQRAWVHVLPLTDAVANNALLEGMACGLPTVTTAVGDVLDYTTDTGAICVAPGDHSGMAEAVIGLLEDPRRRETLGQMAREVAETLRLEAVARQHADIYCEIANRRRFGFGTKLRNRSPDL